ncbi:MAG: hypothetical protein HXX80_06265 [Nitrososphaerales archaeon]|nr:hypothetical protein [Nitrososphaerales archaeon]
MKTLKKGECIRVDWLDANTIKNMPAGEPVTSPDYPMTTIGVFEGIIESEKLSYLTIIVESSDYHKDVTLIPLPLLVKISKSRVPLKQVKITNYCRSVREYERRKRA